MQVNLWSMGFFHKSEQEENPKVDPSGETCARKDLHHRSAIAEPHPQNSGYIR